MATDMFLYWGSGSPPCWKAMLVLEEKGLWSTCENKRLDFSQKEHKGEDVLAINPRGQLPTFKDGDVTVNESGAICMYIEDKFGDKNPLFPRDASKKGEVYQRMFEVQNVEANILLPLVRGRMRGEAVDEDKSKENVTKAKEELNRWEKNLAGKEYLCGDKFTMADVFFFPYLAFLVRVGATLSEYPELKRYHDKVSERPSVKATRPPHWNDGSGPGLIKEL